MKASLFSAIALLIVIALPASARPPHAVTEDGHEFVASMFSLPASFEGSFSVLACTACKRLNFRLDGNTQFFIGRGEVTYADFKRELAGHPRAAVLIVTAAGQDVVTRIQTSLIDTQ